MIQQLTRRPPPARSIGEVIGERIEGLPGSKLSLIREALAARADVTQVVQCGIKYRPGRFAAYWAETVDIWVAPLERVPLQDLNDFALSLLPLNHGLYDAAGSTSLFGRRNATLYYDEDIGTERSVKSHALRGLRYLGLVDDYGVKEAEILRRRTWGRVFTDRYSALEAVPSLESAFHERIGSLNRSWGDLSF